MTQSSEEMGSAGDYWTNTSQASLNVLNYGVMIDEHNEVGFRRIANMGTMNDADGASLKFHLFAEPSAVRVFIPTQVLFSRLLLGVGIDTAIEDDDGTSHRYP
jgi:hypothetical protein